MPAVDLTLSQRRDRPQRRPRPALASRVPERPDGQTFYSQIGANRRNSVLLVVIVLVLFGVLGFSIGYAFAGTRRRGRASPPSRSSSASCWRSGRTSAATRSCSRRPARRRSTRRPAPQLLNVVREMSLAANVPMPKVYVIDDTAPNAFATGRDPKHASVAITTGLLEKLDREELQGVIGHELSHVRNYDIRFALLVGVLVGSIALLADFFLRFSFWGGAGRRSQRRPRAAATALQAIVVRRRDHPGDPRPDRRAPRPARGQPPARVPRRRVVGRADPEPARARAGAGEDRDRPGGARGREPGDPAPVLHEPDQEVRGALEQPLLDPPADRSIGSTGCAS